jgi:hypothetical protein
MGRSIMKTSNDEAHEETGVASRRGFLGLGTAVVVGGQFLGSPLLAVDGMKAGMIEISKDSVTDAGEPILYLNTPNPEISSAIMTIPAGTTTEWMTHPVQGYVYVLEGTLIVEFADGPARNSLPGKASPRRGRSGIAAGMMAKRWCDSSPSSSGARMCQTS